MSIFGTLLKTAIDVAVLPVSVVVDVATMGGAVTGDRSAIAENLEQIGKDVGEIRDEAGKL